MKTKYLKIFVFIIISIVKWISVHSQTITTFAGGGTSLSSGIPATSAGVPNPFDGSFDSIGNYYFSVHGCKIRMVDTAGIIHTVVGTGTPGFFGDGGLATAAQINNSCYAKVDAAGNIYLADWLNNRVRKVDITTGIIHTIAGTGIATSSGDGGSATNATLMPLSLYVDKNGNNIYISDSQGVRIRNINMLTGIITTIAGNGMAGFSGDSGMATNAKIGAGYGLAIDHNDNLIFGSYSRIRKVNLITGIISTIAGTGVSIYNRDEIHADSANFAEYGICIDAIGNIYISDLNNRIRKIDTLGIIHTVAGNGIGGFSGDYGPADSAEINFPEGVAVDGCNNLYIADEYNGRIRKVTFDSTCSLSTLKIQELLNSNSITIYPNPVLANIIIQANNKINSISISNIYGQILFLKANIEDEKAEINIENLFCGVYIITIIDYKSQKTIRKIIKE